MKTKTVTKLKWGIPLAMTAIQMDPGQGFFHLAWIEVVQDNGVCAISVSPRHTDQTTPSDEELDHINRKFTGWRKEFGLKRVPCEGNLGWSFVCPHGTHFLDHSTRIVFDLVKRMNVEDKQWLRSLHVSMELFIKAENVWAPAEEVLLRRAMSMFE